MAKRSKFVSLDQPFYHTDHSRPRTRREFLAQGFTTGAGIAVTSPLALLGQSALALDALEVDQNICATGPQGNGKIPFICFDLAGGANIAGSNVLVGKQNGQLDFLDTAGYRKQGLPPDFIPPVNAVNPNANGGGSGTTDNTDPRFGLVFHKDSAMLRGMMEKAGAIAPLVNGAVIPARSQNDTGNNPHNPMYGIAKAGQESQGLGGANGEILALVGSQNSDSGGNSMAPPGLIDLAYRPTKVDRPSDATGLVDVGGLSALPGAPNERAFILDASYRMSKAKIDQLDSLIGTNGLKDANGVPMTDAQLRNALWCAYAQSADLAERFASGTDLVDPTKDPVITGQIFPGGELGDREFAKTASIMKLVIDGQAGAGTISMGGYDYHTGDRRTGESRDLRAGRCIGACLAYAAAKNTPLMIYVVSDGSVFSNGMTDGTDSTGNDNPGGGGKGVWTGDSQQTAAAFFLVYNPASNGGRATLRTSTTAPTAEQHQQLGWMSPGGDVVTTSSPAANNVEGLVDMVIYNYMALHGEESLFFTKFPQHKLTFPTPQGGTPDLERWLAFEPIVTGTI